MTHPNYPTSSEVDAWCDRLLTRADATEFTVEAKPTNYGENGRPAPRHLVGQQAIAITPSDGCTFHCIWQPAHNGGPAPLLVHVPGYGAEMTIHPSLVNEGFNVIHVNPQGYCTPGGFDPARKVDGIWPVMPETVSSFGERGYVNWLHDVLVAARWATRQPSVQASRLGFFGTSQGGGTALLLASLMKDRGAKTVAADEPYLTGYVAGFDREVRGAYELPYNAMEAVKAKDPARVADAYKAMGLIDTLSHAHRLTMPTLLTAGSIDQTCPPDTIKALFDKLPGTRSYTEMSGVGHGYTAPFLFLATAWFKMYV